MHGYDVLATTLRDLTDAPLFGLLGNANMHLATALADRGEDTIHVRHEATAISMADGYSRVSGKVGVSTVTCGPGLTHAATSLLTCSRGGSPQVVLAGDTVSRDASMLQTMDQAAFAAACEAGFVTVRHPDEIPAAARDAFVRASIERRAILLSIPQDVLDGESTFLTEDEFRLPSPSAPTERFVPAPDEIEELARTLMTAERPILIAGRGCRTDRLGGKINVLAEHIGALVGTTLLAKGMFLDNPWDIGVSGAFASAPGEEVMVGADIVLGIGATMGYYTTEGQLLYPDAEVHRIDIHADAPGLAAGHHLHLGDASSTLDALIGAVRRIGPPRTGYRTPETEALLSAPRPTTWPDLATDGVDPRELMDALAPHIPADARIIVGGGHFWAFPIMYLSGGPGNDWIFSHQFGSIGQTIAVAIGAWFADPTRPIVMFDGDGSLMQHIQELDTVVRHRIPLTLIVGNDGGFGSEVHKLRAAGVRDDVVSFPSPDFAALGRAFGGDGVTVENVSVIREHSDLVTRPERLAVFDARISRLLASDPYRRLHYGEDNRAPRLISGGRA